MAKLSDTQLIVLSKAAQRDDGAAIAPDKMNKPAWAKVGLSLIDRKLMREIRAKPGMPVWRDDDDGRRFSLIITRAGRDAIGIETHGEDSSLSLVGAVGKQDREAIATKDKETGPAKVLPGAVSQNRQDSGVALRPGSKQALVVEMLSGDAGATLDALVRATGWLPHTTRAALTGLRKKGFSIERRAGHEEAPSTWRIVTGAKLAA